MRRAVAAVSVVLAAGLVAPPAAHAAEVPAGAQWSEEYITEADGTVLHADVLRPKHLPADAKTPVILSIGPYFNHTGSLGLLGYAQGEDWNPLGTGPSARFNDFITKAKLMERGYTVVLVDLRGFGGSTGCLDWVGPGEQADVKAAVEWAAKQPWSTGKVGMYGKSYDAVTGLAGIASKPAGLKAVIAQEPVYDMYRYLYMNRVRYTNSLLTPLLYDLVAGSPGSLLDSADYLTASLNDFARPGCPVLNWADQQNNDPGTAYWKARNLIEKTKGSDVPLFLTQGLLEDNTKPDGFADLFNGLTGPKQAWYGMWDHVRGTDVIDGRPAMGRSDFVDQAMRFYDLHLKGIEPAVDDPTITVQTSTGKFRAEQQWPPADAETLAAPLRTGSYFDVTAGWTGAGSEDPSGQGVWTFSKSLTSAAHLAGTPKLTVRTNTLLGNANLVADLYDVDAQDKATLISRGTTLVKAGSSATSFDLFGQDWVLPAGHRLGVVLAPSNLPFWANVPTLQQVSVQSASLKLPFLSCRRDETIAGERTPKLDSYLETMPFTSTKVAANTSDKFPLPPEQQDC